MKKKQRFKFYSNGKLSNKQKGKMISTEPENFSRNKKGDKVKIVALAFSSLLASGAMLYFIFGVQGNNAEKKDVAETSQPIISNAVELKAGENQNNNSDVTFKNLLVDEPDAPVKVMGIGNFYARARSAVAIDAKTSTLLHYQNGKEKMAIASLTKIMTAILVAEKIADLENEIITINEEALYIDGTKVGCPRSDYCLSNRLQLGEKLTAHNLLEAMLINSANDAAVALAVHIAGSEKEFAKLMNEKAKSLGLTDTNFCNPSGLDEEDKPGGCYSTAYDIARIAAYSLQYDQIWQIMKIKEKDIYSTDKTIVHHIINTDILIDQLPNCLGGKTGFTYEAGKSLMMAAHNPSNFDNQIVAVILDDFYRWEDMKDLINWSFQAYNWPKKEVFNK